MFENPKAIAAPERASLWLRACAFALDVLLACAAAWTLCFIFYIKPRYPGFVEDYAAFVETARTLADFADMPANVSGPLEAFNVFICAGVFLYFFFCDFICEGRTLGKRFVRLRATRQSPAGAPLTAVDALIRSLVKSVCLFYLPLLLADALSVFFGRGGYALHDRIARSIVVDEIRRPAQAQEFSETTHE